MQRPHAEKGDVCPLNQLPVEKVCHKCPLYIRIMGTDGNTGKDVDHWVCSLAAIPMLLVENSQQQRQTGAAVNNLRNEVAKSTEQAQNAEDTRLNAMKMALTVAGRGSKFIEG